MKFALVNESKGLEIPLKVSLSAREVGILLRGGLLNSVAAGNK